MESFLKRFFSNHVLANLAFVLVLALGFLTYQQLPREQDPTINFNWIQITTVFPGASANDMERRVTQPLEDAIQTVKDIRFVSSTSRDSVSSILVRFNDIPERQFDKRLSDLRRELQNKERELPDEAETPQLFEITSSNAYPSASLVVVGRADDATLRTQARNIQKDLERLPSVDRVDDFGLRDPELQIYFDPKVLAFYQVTPSDIANTVMSQYRDISAGTVEVDSDRWVIRWQGTQASPDYLSKLPIMTYQGELPLGEIAQVQSGREKPTRLVHYEGKNAVMLSVMKKGSTNVLNLVDTINQYIDNQNASLAETGIELILLDDQTDITKNALDIMQTNALLGLGLVLLSTWLFLGFKIAALVSIGIPFTLGATFLTIGQLDQTLNVSVLLGIVISLGMLVDDSVVIVEAIYYRLNRGQEKLNAVIGALYEVFAPITTSIFTTIATFLPLMLLPGILGKFMLVIPLVVSLALLFSLVEAFWMLPAHLNASTFKFEKPSKIQVIRNRATHLIRIRYTQLLIKVFRRPILTFVLILGLLSFSIVAIGAGWLKFNFFASDPLRIFYVNVEMPAGTPLEKTIEFSESIEQKVRQYLHTNDARSVVSYAGLMFSEMEPLLGDQYGQVLVSLNPKEKGMRDVDDIVDSMREDVLNTPGPLNISFLRLAGGPPTSKPINVKVRGDNFEDIRQAVVSLKNVLNEVPTVSDVSDNDSVGQNELLLTPNLDAIQRAGLDPSSIARTIRLLVDGEIVASLQHQGEELHVRVQSQKQDYQSIDAILQQPIALPKTGNIRLRDLVHVEVDKGQNNIRHYNFRKTITVTAEIDKDEIDTVQANNLIKEEWQTVRARHPGIDLEFSGELDDIQESLDAMPMLFLVGVGLMYLLLGTQFRSYFQPLMILCTIPLAFCGVVIGLLVTNNPMSLFTLYGVVALSGIAVNAAIVLISAANDRLASGMSVLHATLYAARRRVIPIIITSITTIAGLFSLATGLGGKSLLWGPVATAIVWGLVVSTSLTLLVIPLIYRASMQRKQGRLKI